MRKAIYILAFPILLSACTENCKHPQSTKWNEGYDPKHPECFDTVICEDGDSLLIINMAIDSIL